jgi:hypothetical protein
MVFSDTSHGILSKGVKDSGARPCLKCQEQEGSSQSVRFIVYIQGNNIQM